MPSGNSLTLPLQKSKPGMPTPRLQLPLDKSGGVFDLEMFWDCDPKHADDADLHALACTRGKVTGLDRILSTYNTRKFNPSGAIQHNTDGTFDILDGALTHSGDKRVQNNTEIIRIDVSLLPHDVDEIPLIATVHEADHGSEHEGEHESEDEAAFADIEVVKVTIKMGGKVLGTYVLSDEFGEDDVVQLGSIMIENGIAEYAPVGRGFSGDFNDVLAVFS